MLFNTVLFAFFFLVVYSLYLSLKHRWQNRMLLVASYIFYGAWDWHFLSLIWISTLVDYLCGIIIHQSSDAKKRKFFLFCSISINLVILGFFKYFNFFIYSFQELIGIFGFKIQPHFLYVVLPVGISFYTFQTMSYTIDIYYKKMNPTRNAPNFALYVAFFPQLVAGPIERAKTLLPQILSPRKMSLDKFYEGCYLIFWGLFLKVFVADNLALLVDPVFQSGPAYNGVQVLLALYAFAFQIFGDFAGYSNIARGLGKCMGFELMVNFNLPYFATNPSDFWRRWHISLSTWLRDYLYIPLGGNKKGPFKTYRNLGITMLLGGLWHGAAWTFVLWGAYQGALLMIHRWMQPFLERIFSPQNTVLKKVWLVIRIVFFFHIVCIGWLIFRAQSLDQMIAMVRALFFNFEIISGVEFLNVALTFLSFVWLLLVVQIFQFYKKDLMVMYKSNFLLRTLFYLLVYYLLILYGVPGGKEFIYFQF